MTNYIFKNFAANVSRSGIKRKDISRILSLLSLSEIRILLRELKLENEKNSLEATFSDNPSPRTKNELSKKFPDSNISVSVDKSIGAGLKVRKFDMIYDLTVKSKIKNVINTLEEEL